MQSYEYGEISLLVYDFDGVMTDNTVLVDENGKEAVWVNRADGLAIEALRKKGYKQIILSTEANEVVKVRAKKLRIAVINNCTNKKHALVSYCRKHKIPLQQVLYVGNDINDLEVMRIVGIKICPADAHPQIKKIADVITKTKGGTGVIREILDVLNV